MDTMNSWLVRLDILHPAKPEWELELLEEMTKDEEERLKLSNSLKRRSLSENGIFLSDKQLKRGVSPILTLTKKGGGRGLRGPKSC